MHDDLGFLRDVFEKLIEANRTNANKIVHRAIRSKSQNYTTIKTTMVGVFFAVVADEIFLLGRTLLLRIHRCWYY